MIRIDIDHELAYERRYGNITGAEEYRQWLLESGQMDLYIQACRDEGIVNKYTERDKWAD